MSNQESNQVVKPTELGASSDGRKTASPLHDDTEVASAKGGRGQASTFLLDVDPSPGFSSTEGKNGPLFLSNTFGGKTINLQLSESSSATSVSSEGTTQGTTGSLFTNSENSSTPGHVSTSEPSPVNGTARKEEGENQQQYDRAVHRDPTMILEPPPPKLRALAAHSNSDGNSTASTSAGTAASSLGSLIMIEKDPQANSNRSALEDDAMISSKTSNNNMLTDESMTSYGGGTSSVSASTTSLMQAKRSMAGSSDLSSSAAASISQMHQSSSSSSNPAAVVAPPHHRGDVYLGTFATSSSQSTTTILGRVPSYSSSSRKDRSQSRTDEEDQQGVVGKEEMLKIVEESVERSSSNNSLPEAINTEPSSGNGQSRRDSLDGGNSSIGRIRRSHSSKSQLSDGSKPATGISPIGASLFTQPTAPPLPELNFSTSSLEDVSSAVPSSKKPQRSPSDIGGNDETAQQQKSNRKGDTPLSGGDQEPNQETSTGAPPFELLSPVVQSQCASRPSDRGSSSNKNDSSPASTPSALVSPKVGAATTGPSSSLSASLKMLPRIRSFSNSGSSAAQQHPGRSGGASGSLSHRQLPKKDSEPMMLQFSLTASERASVASEIGNQSLASVDYADYPDPPLNLLGPTPVDMTMGESSTTSPAQEHSPQATNLALSTMSSNSTTGAPTGTLHGNGPLSQGSILKTLFALADPDPDQEAQVRQRSQDGGGHDGGRVISNDSIASVEQVEETK